MASRNWFAFAFLRSNGGFGVVVDGVHVGGFDLGSRGAAELHRSARSDVIHARKWNFVMHREGEPGFCLEDLSLDVVRRGERFVLSEERSSLFLDILSLLGLRPGMASLEDGSIQT